MNKSNDLVDIQCIELFLAELEHSCRFLDWTVRLERKIGQNAGVPLLGLGITLTRSALLISSACDVQEIRGQNTKKRKGHTLRKFIPVVTDS